ncbi:c-type cytochrome [Aurantivibrio plasticivorans]
MKKITGCFSVVAVLLGTLFVGSAMAESTTQDGVYIKDQAAQGQKLYKKHCIACHNKDDYGDKFLAWEGQPLGDLYETVSATMPEDNVGGLSLDEYTNIMAYVLYMLKFPAGDTPLNHQDGSMSAIIIQN